MVAIILPGRLGPMIGGGTGGGGGNSAAYTNFIARTSGLDATHQTAYATLLNGLTTDGIFNSDGTTNYLDALYMFATADSTTALLSLVSATFNATVVSSPTFTADAGYNGHGSGHIDSSFNPTTAGSPKYVQDSASLSAWSNSTGSASDSIAGQASSTTRLFLYTDSGGTAFYGMNDSGAYAVTVADASGSGWYSADRNSSANSQGYKNGSQVASASNTSRAPINANLVFCRGDGTLSSRAILAGAIGKSLGTTPQANLYARVHAYLQTIAGIA